MFRGAVVACAGVLAACGFHRGAPGASPVDGELADTSGGSDVAPDVPRAPVTATFGERSMSDHKSVTRDTYVESANPTINHGADIGLWADASPITNGLLRFDLSAIPARASVTSAELDLVTTTDSLESGTLDIYAALEDWTESQANWTDRATGVTWTTAGGSRGTAMIGSIFPGVDLTPYTIPLDAPTVQGWVATPASNHGMVLLSSSPSGNGVTFSSSNDTLVDSRPQLRVTFTP